MPLLPAVSAGTVELSAGLLERLVRAIRERLPLKSFGFLLSEHDPFVASDFVLFETNARTTGVWKEHFERYGQYFVDHENAGFVTTPDEAWQVQKSIWARGLQEVGVFHSHIRHPANFSSVDFDLHVERFPNLWHLIVSMRNPDLPQVRVFGVSEISVRELGLDDGTTPVAAASSPDRALARARQVLTLDRHGRPVCTDARAIVRAIERLERTRHAEAIDEILVRGFLRDSEQRYATHVAPLMRQLSGGLFSMGSELPNAPYFMGESPRHAVQLSPFLLATVPVTQGMYALFAAARANEPLKPVVELTWFDAALCARWMGCRLPTEAEWEYACGAGSNDQWCCPDETSLRRHAWFSDNAGAQLQPVATREPNAFGLFDLHGNVWEWCQDVYDVGFYGESPRLDPVRQPRPAEPDAAVHRVCRGGCLHSFAEMCRTRYRFHERPEFRAADLGFRLARSSPRL